MGFLPFGHPCEEGPRPESDSRISGNSALPWRWTNGDGKLENFKKKIVLELGGKGTDVTSD